MDFAPEIDIFTGTSNCEVTVEFTTDIDVFTKDPQNYTFRNSEYSTRFDGQVADYCIFLKE